VNKPRKPHKPNVESAMKVLLRTLKDLAKAHAEANVSGNVNRNYPAEAGTRSAAMFNARVEIVQTLQLLGSSVKQSDWNW